MGNDFTKTLEQEARYWPKQRYCRADILDYIFCSISSGSKWRDGRVSKRLTRKAAERQFHSLQDSLKRMHNQDAGAGFARKRVVELQAKIDAGDTDPQLQKKLDRYIKMSKPKPFRPDRIRTDAQVAKVVNDRRHRDVIRSEWQRKCFKMVGKEGYRGPTVFCGLCSHAALNNVPDDVRPDWLVGIREVIQMIVAWDTPAQVTSAKESLAALEERFGPSAGWGKLKRRTPSPIEVLEPRDIVGRSVRVGLRGERSWGEHRPDLGPNVYRSLNDTLSGLRVQVPDDYPDAEVVKRNGKQTHFRWGHLFIATERLYGLAKPKYIIGEDLTPCKDDENAA